MSADSVLNKEVLVYAESQLLARGILKEIATKAKAAYDAGKTLLVLDAQTSEVIDFNWHGPVETFGERLKEVVEPRKPGRPRLGVVAREVTLLPRHWEWLNAQPGGASVALRKLVEEARKKNADSDQLRQIQESVCRFMTTLGGDRQGFEEGLRAFYARDIGRFKQETQSWPEDIRQHLYELAEWAFKATTDTANRSNAM